MRGKGIRTDERKRVPDINGGDSDNTEKGEMGGERGMHDIQVFRRESVTKKIWKTRNIWENNIKIILKE